MRAAVLSIILDTDFGRAMFAHRIWEFQVTSPTVSEFRLDIADECGHAINNFGY
jgi:hypothetical protein